MDAQVDEMRSIEAFELYESSVRSYCRDFPAVFSRSMGDFIFDERGERYVDLFCGAGALNYGHNHPSQRQDLLDYISGAGITHSLDFFTEAKRQFITDFQNIILRPRQLEYRMMFCGPTGTNSVEAAIKLARKVTGRSSIGAFTNGYHGMTLGSLAATGSSEKRRGAGVPLSFVDRYPFDGYLGPGVNTVEYIEKLLDDPSSGFDIPAAFLLETVQAEGGINVASFPWLRDLALLARKYGILLIVDDIQTGCGRTGAFFSFDAPGLTPDMVCLSKSLSGYGLPLALVLIRPELDIWTPGEHNGTFRGNNLAFVTASAALRLWNDTNFTKLVDKNCEITRQALAGILTERSNSMTIRGRGLIWGLAFDGPAQAAHVSKRMFEKKVIVETCGARQEVVKLLPALNINPDILEESLSILRAIVLNESDYC